MSVMINAGCKDNKMCWHFHGLSGRLHARALSSNSGIGYIYAELPEDKQEKFLIRLVLRNKLVTRLFQASKNGNINMREFLFMLSDSTYLRRKSNVKAVLNVLEYSKEVDFSKFIEKIKM